MTPLRLRQSLPLCSRLLVATDDFVGDVALLHKQREVAVDVNQDFVVEHTFDEDFLTLSRVDVGIFGVFFGEDVLPVEVEVKIGGDGAATRLHTAGDNTEQVGMEQPFATLFHTVGERIVDDALVGVTFYLVVGLAHRFRDILVLALHHDEWQSVHKADDVGNDEGFGVVGIDAELVDGNEGVFLVFVEVDDFGGGVILAGLFVLGAQMDALQQHIVNLAVGIHQRFVDGGNLLVAVVFLLLGNPRIKLAEHSADFIDYFLTDSVFEEEVFHTSFWPHVEQLKFGHPRNDILFSKEKMSELRDKVYKFYKIEPHVKTVLYAPTFRDNKSDVSAIKIDCIKLKETLKKKFGGEWKVIVKAHMHNRHNAALRHMFANRDSIIDASDYIDMQELIAAADVGITDYSSWIFDFVLKGAPAFIYARDIKQYINSRGFFYPLDQTPFSIAETDEELSGNIMDFDSEAYAKAVKAFLDDKQCYENGHAAERTVDFICELSGRSAE